MRKWPVALLAILVAVISSCEKQTERFSSASLADYYPLVTGTTLFYRLDSTVPAPFGTALLIKSYQAKDSVESTFTDNEGRRSFRIFRYIRDLAGQLPWRFASTYVATPTATNIEYVDNNLRFIKLQMPIRNDFSFKAHSYIDTKSLNSTVPYLDEWEYMYSSVGEPYSINNAIYNNTITVLQHDETTPEGPFSPTIPYQQRNYGIEVYAEGIGLIYKEFLHWTWQSTPPPSKYEDGSYGVKLTLMPQ